MNSRGFTLIELLVVIVVIGILSTIATLEFNKYIRRSSIEKQVNELFADIMNARTQSLYRRVQRTVKITGTTYSLYPSSDTSGTPIETKTLRYPIKSGSATTVTIDFAESGLLTAVDDNTSICVNSEDNADASVDGLVLSATRLQLGKWTNPGGTCASENITIR